MSQITIDKARIGTSSPHFSLVDFRTMYERVHRDFAIWEIIVEGDHHPEKISGPARELLASDPMDLQVHVPIGDVNIGSISDRMRDAAVEEVIGALKFAAEVGADPVTVHPGHFSPTSRGNTELLNKRMMDSIRKIGKAAEDLGIVAGLENMPNFPFAHIKHPGELLETIEGTGLFITFDIGHASTCDNLAGFLYPGIVDLVKNVHIHDNFGKMDDHVALGNGNIDLPMVVRELEGLGFTGSYIIETKNFEDSMRGLEYMGHIGDIQGC
jgi:sugar phosphate isomerase/epimerase